jgi:hypothetical protein
MAFERYGAVLAAWTLLSAFQHKTGNKNTVFLEFIFGNFNVNK